MGICNVLKLVGNVVISDAIILYLFIVIYRLVREPISTGSIIRGAGVGHVGERGSDGKKDCPRLWRGGGRGGTVSPSSSGPKPEHVQLGRVIRFFRC